MAHGFWKCWQDPPSPNFGYFGPHQVLTFLILFLFLGTWILLDQMVNFSPSDGYWHIIYMLLMLGGVASDAGHSSARVDWAASLSQHHQGNWHHAKESQVGVTWCDIYGCGVVWQDWWWLCEVWWWVGLAWGGRVGHQKIGYMATCSCIIVNIMCAVCPGRWQKKARQLRKESRKWLHKLVCMNIILYTECFN